jgi:hypothetical protein
MEEFCYMSCPHWSRLAQSHVEKISLSALKSVEPDHSIPRHTCQYGWSEVMMRGWQPESDAYNFTWSKKMGGSVNKSSMVPKIGQYTTLP